MMIFFKKKINRFEINTLIGTSGMFHAEVWKFLGGAKGWELVHRTRKWNTRTMAKMDAKLFTFIN